MRTSPIGAARTRALVACLLLAVVAGGCTRASPPDVVVILLDTVRADGLEPYGARAGASPVLAKLAEESIVFANAYSSSSFTTPSVASLFTGRYATHHGVTIGLRARELRSTEAQTIALPQLDGLPLLPAILFRAGYRTFGVSGNPQVGQAIGFERGFQRFVETRMAPRILDKLREWAPDIEAAEPSFVYVHINDAHKPYLIRQEAYRKPKDPYLWPAAAYASEIAYVDGVVREVLDIVDPRDEAVVLVVTDHGEEFGDHGGQAHGFSLHVELNRIAAILRVPGRAPQRVETNVSMVDLLPTLLDVVGVPAPDGMDGRSLVPLIELEAGLDADAEVPDDWRLRPLFAHREEQASQGRVLEAVIRGDWKVIVGDDGTQLYHVPSDRREQKDLSDRAPELVAELRALLAEVPRIDPETRTMRETSLNEEQLEELRALGYVEGSVEGSVAGSVEGPVEEPEAPAE